MSRGCKTWVPIIMVILLFVSFPAFASEENVSITAISEDAKVVFRNIAESCGLNIVVDDSITSRITVSLTDVPYDQALQTVALIAGANVRYDNGVYVIQNSRVIYPSTTQTEQTSTQVFDLSRVNYDNAIQVIRAIASKMEIEEFPEINVVLLRGSLSEMNQVRSTIDQYLRDSQNNQTVVTDERIMSIVRVIYADASETASAVQGQFANVRVQVSRQSSSIVLYGPEREVEQVKNAIKELDRAPAVLNFQVEIIEISDSDGSHLGIDWGNSQGQMGTFSVSLTEASPVYSSTPASQIDFRPWTRASLNIVANIRLMQEEGKATVIARPFVTVIENKTARINTTDRYTIMTSGSTYPQYVDAGVLLEISGKVDENGDIIVTLSPKVSGVVGFSKEGYPIISTREVTTTVILKPGETLVIGGLMRIEEMTTESGIPFLSKIPIIGYLFGSTKTSTKTTEVVIILTPQVSGNQILF